MQTWFVIAIVVAGAACSKDGADGPSTVRGFVEAIAAGELDRARGYLPD